MAQAADQPEHIAAPTQRAAKQPKKRSVNPIEQPMPIAGQRTPQSQRLPLRRLPPLSAVAGPAASISTQAIRKNKQNLSSYNSRVKQSRRRSG